MRGAAPGYLFHIDFGFVLGDDPKPLSPPVRLPAQIAQALIASKRLNKCLLVRFGERAEGGKGMERVHFMDCCKLQETKPVAIAWPNCRTILQHSSHGTSQGESCLIRSIYLISTVSTGGFKLSRDDLSIVIDFIVQLIRDSVPSL